MSSRPVITFVVINSARKLQVVKNSIGYSDRDHFKNDFYDHNSISDKSEQRKCVTTVAKRNETEDICTIGQMQLFVVW